MVHLSLVLLGLGIDTSMVISFHLTKSLTFTIVEHFLSIAALTKGLQCDSGFRSKGLLIIDPGLLSAQLQFELVLVAEKLAQGTLPCPLSVCKDVAKSFVHRIVWHRDLLNDRSSSDWFWWHVITSKDFVLWVKGGENVQGPHLVGVILGLDDAKVLSLLLSDVQQLVNEDTHRRGLRAVRDADFAGLWNPVLVHRDATDVLESAEC